MARRSDAFPPVDADTWATACEFVRSAPAPQHGRYWPLNAKRPDKPPEEWKRDEMIDALRAIRYAAAQDDDIGLYGRAVDVLARMIPSGSYYADWRRKNTAQVRAVVGGDEPD